jgi:hypothetical protein
MADFATPAAASKAGSLHKMAVIQDVFGYRQSALASAEAKQISKRAPEVFKPDSLKVASAIFALLLRRIQD